MVRLWLGFSSMNSFYHGAGAFDKMTPHAYRVL
jgi:hypothetical protein